MLRRLAGDRQWRDVDAADIRTARSHLNASDSRDDSWGPDSDVQLVGSCVDGFIDILAADVRVRCARSDEADEEAKDDAKTRRSELHRCTLRIQRPKLNPIHALMEA